MYGKPVVKLSIEEILKRVSEWDLWSYYIPGIELGTKFKSPLRKDNDPSASLFIAYDGHLLLNDFKLGSYTIWKFLQEKYNLSFAEVLLTINNDFNLNLTSVKINRPTTQAYFGLTGLDKPITKKETILKIKARDWNDADKKYWESFGLSTSFLTKHYVKPLLHYWINNQYDELKLVYWYNEYNPSYSYEFGNAKRKIYAPLNEKKDWKFITNATEDIVQGDRFLPESGDILIITKSYKDVLVLTSLGFNSVAPQSESTKLNEEKINNYKQRYKEIYILYDNDETGINYSKKYAELFNLNFILIPEITKCKDISDFRKEHNKIETIGLLEKLLQK